MEASCESLPRISPEETCPHKREEMTPTLSRSRCTWMSEKMQAAGGIPRTPLASSSETPHTPLLASKFANLHVYFKYHIYYASFLLEYTPQMGRDSVCVYSLLHFWLTPNSDQQKGGSMSGRDGWMLDLLPPLAVRTCIRCGTYHSPHHPSPLQLGSNEEECSSPPSVVKQHFLDQMYDKQILC